MMLCGLSNGIWIYWKAMSTQDPLEASSHDISEPMRTSSLGLVHPNGLVTKNAAVFKIKAVPGFSPGGKLTAIQGHHLPRHVLQRETRERSSGWLAPPHQSHSRASGAVALCLPVQDSRPSARPTPRPVNRARSRQLDLVSNLFGGFSRYACLFGIAAPVGHGRFYLCQNCRRALYPVLFA